MALLSRPLEGGSHEPLHLHRYRHGDYFRRPAFPSQEAAHLTRSATTGAICRFLGMEGRTMINWAILGFVIALGSLGLYLTRKRG